MKIVRRFVDNEFARHRSHELFKPNAFWQWGLGDDGELYAMGTMSGHSITAQWYPFRRLSIGIGLDDMLRIMENLSILETTVAPGVELSGPGPALT